MRTRHLRSRRSASGLVVIEKVIMIAMLGWIVVITPLAIQSNRGRAQVVEGYALMRPIQLAVNDYLKAHGTCPPADPAALGVSAGSGRFVRAVSLDDHCVIKATYGDGARERLQGTTLAWYAGVDARRNIHWSCGTASPEDLGSDPLIPYGATPADTTATYAPWLPTRCHPPRPESERKPSVVLFIERMIG